MVNICIILLALPLSLVIQSTGFSSCGTHLAAPPSESSESRMTQISNADRFSAPVYCSLVRLSYSDLASVIAAMSSPLCFSVMMDVMLISLLSVCRFVRS